MSRIGPFRLVVFDCDGTLVDSQHAIHGCMAATFREHGLAEPSPAAVRGVIGLNLGVAIAQLGGGSATESLTERYRRLFQAWRARGDLPEPLYPGAVETIAELAGAGVLLGVATGKSRRGLRGVLERHDLGRHFVTLQTSDDAPGKPHPAMLQQAMDQAGVAPEETAMVGDSRYDMAMARAAGSAAIGVDWGYQAADALRAEGAHLVVADYAGLLPALRGFAWGA
ncbi:MAG: HAD-IA family hydrolase [Alphaproteobacteria bacterium]|nr:HAD-IA family hydrolase [Alphaproteobacteria bacterium]